MRQARFQRITDNGKRDKDPLKVTNIVPANTRVTVYVPKTDAVSVTESGEPAAQAEGVKSLRMGNNAGFKRIGSSTDRIQSRFP